MNRVFADSFFYLAVLNRDDAAHARAMAHVEKEAGTTTVTTVAVMLEVADALSAPTSRISCVEFLDNLAVQPNTIVRSLDDELLACGMALYGRRSDKEWSLTDCISFVVMEQEGLTQALSGDHHFEQAGFVALLK